MRFSSLEALRRPCKRQLENDETENTLLCGLHFGLNDFLCGLANRALISDRQSRVQYATFPSNDCLAVTVFVTFCPTSVTMLYFVSIFVILSIACQVISLQTVRLAPKSAA